MAAADPRPPHVPLALLLAMAACGDNGGIGNAEVTGPGITSVTTVPVSTGETASTGTTDASTGASGTDADTSTTTGDGPRLDVGAESSTTGPAEPVQGCDKVDFLFVIDNSKTMLEEQQKLLKSFPAFLHGLQTELGDAQDYHFMVVDSDAYVFGGCVTLCPLFFNTCPLGYGHYECGVTTPKMCEDVLGAGVIYPKGQNSSSKACNFATGSRYMDMDEPDPLGAFECVAKVGTGSTEDPPRPMQAMVNALALKGMSAECNAGFLRKDAILVVTFITNQDDNANDGSQGTVDGWRNSLRAAKKWDETALVVLGLFGDTDKPEGICPPFDEQAATGAEPSPRIRQFMDVWGERGLAGSVCASSYDPFFKEAIGLIHSTCDAYFPRPT